MNDPGNFEDANAPSPLPHHLLERMATDLEVNDPVAIAKLGERVEAAMREYKLTTEFARPSPNEMRETFQDIYRHYRGLYDGLKHLEPRARSILDDASLEIHEVRRGRDGRFGMDEAMAALQKVGILIRQAQRQLPKVKRGPQPDRARLYLVHRLGAIYATSRKHIRDDGTEEFEMPTRRHNAYKERDKDYG
ncbi:MAG: hypothetical protein V3R98_04250, partial [Alphaproteobacteria bacterium]